MTFKVKFSNMGLKVNRHKDGVVNMDGVQFRVDEPITVYGVQEVGGDTLFLLYTKGWTWEYSGHYEPYED